MKKYKSNFEATFANHLKARKLPVQYEVDKIKFIVPESTHIYHPDFKIGDNIYVETKGRFTAGDRAKMLRVVRQHPSIRFIMVFMEWNLPINKGSKTTYKMWCDKNGIECYNRVLPINLKV